METAGDNTPKRRREKKTNTTLKQFCMWVLPDTCFRFLYSSDEEYKLSKLFLGAMFGSFQGLGAYFLFVHPMTVEEDKKTNIMYGLSGTFALGWAISSYFRCATLILLPNILGKEGRTYLVIAVMASIYAGPVVNMQKNIEEIARSVSCTVDLQINHTKMMWKEMTKPMKNIIQNLVGSSKELKNRSSSILSAFKEMENEVASTEGYNRQEEVEVQKQQKTQSTQKKLELKTKLRCEYVIELGINKCKDWFAQKHEACMRAIWLPVLNSILCLPMKFSFLCNVMYLINRWCKNRLPLEGNFGQAFDQINDTVHDLGKSFSSTLVVKKEERDVMFGVNISKLSITEEVKETMKKKQVWVVRKMPYINTIMSCMFIFLFTSAFSYTTSYNNNIQHDNFYITTYFRQIDAHRRKQELKYLLPLRNVEKVESVFPFNLCVQGPERKAMIMELLQSFPFLTIFILTMGFDRFLIHIFKVIHKHFQVSYVFSVEHKLEVLVGGDTFLARLLRYTVRAFNSSSKAVEIGDNTVCLPKPSIMSVTRYIYSSLPAVGLLSLCFFQVYGYRLRRVIAGFFFPKREKSRVIFLYNHYIRKRKWYLHEVRSQVMTKFKNRQLWERTFLGKFIKSCRWTRHIIRWRCIVCETRRNKDSHECRTPGCYTVYCDECWWDMDQFCLACVPYEQYIMDSIDD